jgi:tetratricopeptide (TPR) repeat protein
MKRLLPLIFIGSLLPFAAGDVIHLKDGTQVEGEIKKGDDGYTVHAVDGTTTQVPMEKVASIEVKAAATPEASMGRLQSLRRAVENIPDMKVILDRYTGFIAQNPGTPAAAEAKADMDIWRDRQARGLVRVGGNWVTPEERAEVQRKMLGVADQLRATLKAGRLKEASTVLDRALADDPQNMSLLYLRGVLAYRKEELPISRKAFEAVVAQAADHAPSLNNLAVVLWRQNAMGAALNDYDAAMLAAPVSQEILDNVAEALNALPENQRKSTVTAKVVRHFKEQDEALQKKMAEKGLTRWGSTWVTEAQGDKLAAAEKEIRSQVDQMSKDFDAVQARINTIDQTITEDQNEMRQIDAECLVSDPNGKVYRIPYPPRYYTLGQEITSLQNERAAKVSQEEKLRRDAKLAMQKLPVAKYTGIQKIIDVDGMPVVMLAPPLGAVPATQPALH